MSKNRVYHVKQYKWDDFLLSIGTSEPDFSVSDLPVYISYKIERKKTL